MYFCLFVCFPQEVVRKIERTNVKASKPEKECIIKDSGLLDLPKGEPFKVDKAPVEE